MKSATIRCATCNARCWSTADVPECADCQRRRQAGEFWSPDKLEDGRWVGRGGIVRWVASEERASLPTPRREPVNLSELIACPTCHARVTEACKTANGNTTAHHKRVVSRRCPCGELIERRKTMCDPCREKARAETYRQREIRTPTATRRRTAA